MMKCAPNTDANINILYDVSAANTKKSIEAPADASETWNLLWVAGSYSADAASGSLSVSVGGTVVFHTYIHDGRLHFFEFPGGIYGAKGDAITAEIAAGGGAVTGMVSMGYK